MYKRVTWDLDQEGTAEDMARVGLWPQEGITRLTDDLLVSGRMFKGFTVTPSGNTAIAVSAGRIYDVGAMYAMEAEATLSVAEYVPFLAGQKVYVTLIGQGREDDGYIEARNYEREVPQSGGGTAIQQVPQSGARARVRNAILTLYPGAPSVIPVKPSIPIGTVAIADVLIGTGGIETITRRTENEAPELDALATAYTALNARFALVDQEIAGLRNDLAALAARLRNGVSWEAFRTLAGDVATVKDLLAVPDTGVPYGADRFLTTDETDTASIDYQSRVLEGIRFPLANFDRRAIALYNPNDQNLRHAAAGLICPKYTAVDGIKLWERAGTVALGGTTYQTMELTQLTMSRTELAYGDYFNVCENVSWWLSGQYDPAAGIFRIGDETYEVVGTVGNAGWQGHEIKRVRKFWTTTVEQPYDVYAPVTHTIAGVVKAQTWLQAQDRFIPAAFLAIERWSAGSEVTATLVECLDSGQPNKGRMLATCTLASTEFEVFPEPTTFPFPIPVLAEAGKMYGIIFATTGEVYCANAEGQKFLQGTYFESTDGSFFAGDLTKDLCFGVKYCRFDVTSLPVLLQGLNLDGGIHNMRLRTAALSPANTAVAWQIQVGGAWREIVAPEGDETLFGAGVTPYYDWRVVLTGNQWVMPIIDMGASEIEVFRAAVAMKHPSTVIAFGTAVTSLTVRATIGAWEAARHTLAAKILHGANYASVKDHAAVETKPVIGADGLVRADAVDMIWTFDFTGAPISTCKVRFSGTTDNARATFHVEQRIHYAE
ncbi:hypothetical protein PQJ75_13530 [Rhodoplanes sp. TEM]|uniref:Tip attachment protein J domain-containing protein n=1 Tax=Rhodoplanes tepidamans TaxID=200616 RepID=A0ABT5JCL9_RHOTP|nr:MULTISPECIES: hypothetical protein [Rhodoplanes]MDC7787367.1 hypothetical protein [Rhodoplanes tepidamans]MDC7984751.1 hypothetical protein [Rhodoplanes sp. TEM]MDQ0358278.1 hypothetical protein [Rhodoplanes tepidamans]